METVVACPRHVRRALNCVLAFSSYVAPPPSYLKERFETEKYFLVLNSTLEQHAVPSKLRNEVLQAELVILSWLETSA